MGRCKGIYYPVFTKINTFEKGTNKEIRNEVIQYIINSFSDNDCVKVFIYYIY